MHRADDDLDLVAIGIEHDGAVIVRADVEMQTGRTHCCRAMLERGEKSFIHFLF